MVRKIVIFTIIIFGTLFFSASSCQKMYDLQMTRSPYTGNELRIDGYYYSDWQYKQHPEEGARSLTIFYRNGVCIHTLVHVESPDTLKFLENNVILNDEFMSSLRSRPVCIGVFQIDGQELEFETWTKDWDYITFSHYGKILNDTTFFLSTWKNNQTGTSYAENSTYHFKPFSPKPDSTCVYIK